MIPTPSPEALVHQQKLLQYLSDYCQQNGGRISFAEFMRIALYAPGLGYYSAGMHKIGAQGDFVTAPEISSLFSHCVARQCQEVLAHLDHPAAILELGAGTGRMASDILNYLAKENVLPSTYFILEVSADLKERQHRYLQENCPQAIDRVVWLDALPEQSFNGIILGNEVLDAMPVHLFQIGPQQEILEGLVQQDNGEWQFVFDTPLSSGLIPAVQQILADNPLSTGYTSEVNLSLPAWLASLVQCLEKGVLLFIDYGFGRQEYYHPDRTAGTLMCHYRHHAHADPLKNIGLQDITAHVDFTALALAAHDLNLTLLGYANQAAFLLANGLLSLPTDLPIQEQLQLSQQIQQLTQPHEMGELFKVIALGKNFIEPLTGFQLRDIRHRL